MLEQLFDQLEGVLPTPGSRMNLPDKITIVDAGKLRFIDYIAGWRDKCAIEKVNDKTLESLYSECQAELLVLDAENARYTNKDSGMYSIAASPGDMVGVNPEEPENFDDSDDPDDPDYDPEAQLRKYTKSVERIKACKEEIERRYWIEVERIGCIF
jgi:hypothetical protein